MQNGFQKDDYFMRFDKPSNLRELSLSICPQCEFVYNLKYRRQLIPCHFSPGFFNAKAKSKFQESVNRCSICILTKKPHIINFESKNLLTGQCNRELEFSDY